MTTSTRRAHAPAWVLAFLATVLAIVLGALTAGPASAATHSAAQNAVGASTPAAQVAVGPSASITAGQRLGNDPPQPPTVVATGVAEVGAALRTVDRGDGRNALGQFTGRGGYGASAEAQGLAQYGVQHGVTPVASQIRAAIRGADDLGGRFYDGLVRNADGTYTALEVKSGTASLTARQRAFDAVVSPANPATAVLNGQVIKITSVEVVRVT